MARHLDVRDERARRGVFSWSSARSDALSVQATHCEIAQPVAPMTVQSAV
jgi:hypothetical protein